MMRRGGKGRPGIGKVFRAGIGKKPNPRDHYGPVNGHQEQIYLKCDIHQHCHVVYSAFGLINLK